MRVLDINPRAGGSTCAILSLNSHQVTVVESNTQNISTLQANVDINLFPYKPSQMVELGSKSWDIIVGHYSPLMEVSLCRVVGESRPKAIILDSVKGKDPSIIRLKVFLRRLGYQVLSMKVEAKRYGICLNDRIDLMVATTEASGKIEYPAPQMKRIRLVDAWVGVPKSYGEVFHPNLLAWYGFLSEGGNLRNLPIGMQEEVYSVTGINPAQYRRVMVRLEYLNTVKFLPQNPSSLSSSLCHPKENRPPTIREYARIKGFPDSWMFEGSVTSQYKQIATSESPHVLSQFYKPVFDAVEGLK